MKPANCYKVRRISLLAVGLFILAAGIPGCVTGNDGDVESRAVPPASQQGQGPIFPQKFYVQGPEMQSFGFAVTQPGPIVVDVRGQGARMIVTLQSPGGQPITQQAVGNLRLNYMVTPQDVQRSLFWTVQIRLAQPQPPQEGGRATGSVNVQYPPVNQSVLQQAIQAASAQRRQPTDQERAQAAVQAKAEMDAAFQAHKAQFEQQRQQRHAALIAGVQPVLAQMQAQTAGAVRSRGVEDSATSETPPASEEDVMSRGLYGGRLTLSPAQPNPVISSACVPTPVPQGQAPQCVTHGQPLDPVTINGSGFGTSPGEVHFILGPNTDVVYPGQTWWYDNQILANVPDASGLVAYNGYLYIVRTSDKAKSALIPFQFVPATEIREIRATVDRLLGQPYDGQWTTADTIARSNGNPFAGFNGNDQLFYNTRLNNTWISDQAFVYCQQTFGGSFCNGGAYVWDTKQGTNWPYLNVRWSVNPAPFGSSSDVWYNFSVHIKGPKGVPDGVVCTQTPCKTSQ